MGKWEWSSISEIISRMRRRNLIFRGNFVRFSGCFPSDFTAKITKYFVPVRWTSWLHPNWISLRVRKQENWDICHCKLHKSNNFLQCVKCKFWHVPNKISKKFRKIRLNPISSTLPYWPWFTTRSPRKWIFIQIIFNILNTSVQQCFKYQIIIFSSKEIQILDFGELQFGFIALLNAFNRVYCQWLWIFTLLYNIF